MMTKLILNEEDIIKLLKQYYNNANDIRLSLHEEGKCYGLAEHEVSTISAEIIFYSDDNSLI